MIHTFLLALRNIFRNKRRTAITFFSIITGVTAIVIFGGFIEFSFQGLREITIRTQLGHLQIYRKGYVEKGVADSAGYLIDNPNRIEEVLAEVPEISTITRRLTFSGLVSTGERTLNASVLGVIPEREGEFSDFETIVQGRQLGPDTPNGGVVGLELMNSLGAEVGDWLTLLTTTLDGVINALDFQVVGVAQTGAKEYDSVFLKLPMPLVQQALNTTKVEKIIVLLEKTEQLTATLPMIEARLAKSGLDLEYQLWDDLAYFYHRVVALYTGMFNVFSVIIGVVVLFSIVNTMSMAVFERTREIGTLRAIGASRLKIMQLFLTEGMCVGLLGGIAGVLFASGVAYLINVNGGIDIPPPPGMSRGYRALILIEPDVLLYGFALTMGVTVLSSVYPAYAAARMKIVEALQYT